MVLHGLARQRRLPGRYAARFKPEAPMARKPEPAQSKAFSYLIDSCEIRGFETRLRYVGKGVVILDVFDGEELIARGRSGLGVPLCFGAVAQSCRRCLEKSGKLSN